MVLVEEIVLVGELRFAEWPHARSAFYCFLCAFLPSSGRSVFKWLHGCVCFWEKKNLRRVMFDPQNASTVHTAYSVSGGTTIKLTL